MCKQVIQFRHGRRPTVLKTRYKRSGDVINLSNAVVALTHKKQELHRSLNVWQDIGLGLRIAEIDLVERQLAHCVKVYLFNK